VKLKGILLIGVLLGLFRNWRNSMGIERTIAATVTLGSLLFGVEGLGEIDSNVLFILVDDLKNTLGAYGDELAMTPNFDALFAQSVQFENMHSQKSECAPSRASMLSGMRPDRIRLWNFQPVFRKRNKKLMTLPGLFRQKGYNVEGVGKVFDNRSFGRNFGSKPQRAPDLCRRKRQKWCSWDRYVTFERIKKNYGNICKNGGTEFFPGSGLPPLDRTSHLVYSFPDELEAKDKDVCFIDLAIERLEHLASANKPFFLAVGFSRPHMPWTMPQRIKEHFDAIPDASFEPDPTPPGYWTDISLEWSRSWSREMTQYDDYASVSTANRVRGYYGAVAFVDELLGQLLDALNAFPKVANNTHIVVWGDHGFHLGDRDIWAKKTVFDQATRIPFAIKPSQKWLEENPDVEIVVPKNRVFSPTDSVDIFPTLADLCEIKLPKRMGLAGTSLVPLIRDPTSAVRAAAVSQYESYVQIPGTREIMGYSIRTTHYRLVVYVPEFKANNLRRKKAYRGRDLFKNVLGVYHYSKPGGIETENQVDNPEHKEARKKLLELFRNAKDRNWSDLINQMPFDHPEN